MISDVVIHLTGKLPLLADLHKLPGPRDQSVLATNVRTRDGKRPSFAERTDGWFIIPLREISVIELPPTALEHSKDERPGPADNYLDDAPGPIDTAPLEPDAELLARIRDV